MNTLKYLPLGALLLSPSLAARPSLFAQAEKGMAATQEKTAQSEEGQRLCKMSEMNGLAIHNRVVDEGKTRMKKVADFADLIFDIKSMEPQYALFSRGGLGAIGDTLIAVPIDQLTSQWKPAEEMDELPTLQLITDLSVERLEKAPEFSEVAWKKNDATWISETSRYFQDATAGKDAKLVEASASTPRMLRLSEILGNTLHSPKGEKLADVQNVILNPETMEVAFVVVGSGGVLGIGEELRAIPFEAIHHELNADGSTKCMTTLTQAQLEAAPVADPDLWKIQGTTKFAERVKKSVRISEARRKKSEEAM